jgi:RES domain-containing protein
VTVAISLWRIGTETKEYKANDLSGGGAAAHPGRWNAAGEHVVYAARTLSLAALETAAHIDDSGLPLNRFVIHIKVPPALWRRRQTLTVSKLDPAWLAVPHGKASVDEGSNWYKSASSALLLVPSVIVPEEHAVLINAKHPEAKQIKAETIRLFEYNKLFRGA